MAGQVAGEVKAGVLSTGYVEAGPADGPAVGPGYDIQMSRMVADQSGCIFNHLVSDPAAACHESVFSSVRVKLPRPVADCMSIC